MTGFSLWPKESPYGDPPFSTPPSLCRRRTGAANVATRAGTRLVLVETICDQATVAARLAARAARGDSPSDATMATYVRQRAALTATPPPVPPNAVTVQ